MAQAERDELADLIGLALSRWLGCDIDENRSGSTPEMLADLVLDRYTLTPIEARAEYGPCKWCDDGAHEGKASCVIHICEACCRPRRSTRDVLDSDNPSWVGDANDRPDL